MEDIFGMHYWIWPDDTIDLSLASFFFNMFEYYATHSTGNVPYDFTKKCGSS